MNDDAACKVDKWSHKLDEDEIEASGYCLPDA